MKYIDAHGHIHSKEFYIDREEVIARMKKSEVGCITVGTSLQDSIKAVALAEKHENIWATIGVHPTDTDEIFDEKEFEDLVKNPKVVAIGECGLDYFHEKDEAKREIQKGNFKKQVKFSLKHDKPLMIHCRPSIDSEDAHLDMLGILTDEKSKDNKLKGNIHFFTGSGKVAEKYFTLGFSVSIPGVVTFARDVAKVVKGLPIERVLAETDCPYATPVPNRGKRNEPIFVVDTIRKIAELKGVELEKIEKQLLNNTRSAFRL